MSTVVKSSLTTGVVENLGDIFSAFRDLVYIYSPMTLQITYANRAASELTGLLTEELMQRTITDLLPEVSPGNLQRIMAPVLVEPEYALCIDTFHIAADGLTLPVEVQLQSVPLADGSRQCLAVIRDVSSRELNIRLRREAEERFRQAFDTSADPMSISEWSGTLIAVNKAFCELSGYSSKELLGKSALALHLWNDPEKDRRRMVEQLRSTGKVKDLEATFLTKGGRSRIALLSATLLPVEGAEPTIFASLHDITDQRAGELERRTLERQLAEAKRLKSLGTLAGGMAHEFNNILGNISGFAELALEDVEEVSLAAIDLKKILAKTDQAVDLVQKLLHFSRSQPGEKTVLDLALLVEGVVLTLRDLLPEGLQVETRIEQGGNRMKADPVAMQQILLNICMNAAEAMEENGLLIIGLQPLWVGKVPNSLFSELESGAYLHLYIKDMGKGMDALIMDRAFDPFYTTKKIGQGTGMGLSVVHGLVEDHKGIIKVNSRKGYGTTFHLAFPVSIARASETDVQSSALPGGNERIVLVDDDPVFVEGMAKMLERLGYAVNSCFSADQALDFIRSSPAVDLLITDQVMPGVSGVELIRQARRFQPDLSVLLLCDDFVGPVRDQDTMGPGVLTLFFKPMRIEQLAQYVRKAVARVAR